MERINIAGAGLAGLSAAISLAENGIACNLISLQPSERAQSVLAEGGVNAVLETMGEGDTFEEHFSDTMRGGIDLADPNAVYGMVSQAPSIIRWLVRLGTPFQMRGKELILRNFGGQKKKRTAYAKSSTGKIVMSALIDEARKYEAMGKIVRYPHHEVVDLVFREEKDVKYCKGLKIRDIYSDAWFFCYGPVILATGGLNGMFPEQTTGTTQNTGNIMAMAFVQGTALANLEFIQYHPTTVSIPGKRLLISEAARGEGGRLFILRNGEPWYFMEELYPELGNLMPRDVITREIVNVRARDDCEDQVYLDLTKLPKETFDKKLSDMCHEIKEYLSVDLASQPVKVSPGIHFFMGGFYVDEQHRTNIPGLYAAGECACQYHGANRLGGNSILGALYGGKIAAKSALSDQQNEIINKGVYDNRNAKGGNNSPVLIETISEQTKVKYTVSPYTIKPLHAVMAGGLGIIRNEDDILSSLSRLDAWIKTNQLTVAEYNRTLLGRAMLLSALYRRESRGAHCRADYPQRNDAQYKKTTVAICHNSEIKIEYRSIPKRRAARENQH